MKSCTVLFLLALMSGLTLAVPSIPAKLHQSTTLPCRRKCSASVKWFLTHKRETVLAECDRTSCHVKDGFGMSHEQFLKGNLSLTVTAADYSRRTWYTCQCDSKDVCDVRLTIEPVMSLHLVKPGEDLVMSLPIPEPVEVIYYNRDPAGSSGEEICRMSSGSLQCEAEYRDRISYSQSDLTLRGVTVSDCGAYTIQDMENNEIIHTYTVYMAEKTEQVSVVLAYVIGLVIAPILIVLMGMNVYLRKENSELKRRDVHQETFPVIKVRGREQELVL